jgi:hypothetical protein
VRSFYDFLMGETISDRLWMIAYVRVTTLLQVPVIMMKYRTVYRTYLRLPTKYLTQVLGQLTNGYLARLQVMLAVQ